MPAAPPEAWVRYAAPPESMSLPDHFSPEPTMTEIKPRKWTPIEPLQADWKRLEDPGIAVLAGVWQEQVAELHDKDIYTTFLSQLRRQWAIETGVLERLYDIKDAATKILIEHGLDVSLLATSDVDRPVAEVMALLRDQERAIESMYAFIAQGRSLALGYVRELHAVLTEHQDTAEAEDASGRVVAIPLVRGEWRKTEAQVTDSNGATWFYCEPALLESQMLNLVEEHARQVAAGVPVEIRAAWLHHRFTLIHPFQDGNGRVARCLATLVMLKAGWFPLVVTRYDKPKYIGALRAADAGDLKPLVELFNDLQKRTIRRALSLSASVINTSESVMDALAAANDRLADRVRMLAESEQRVRTVAEVLRLKAQERLQAVAAETDTMLKKHDSRFSAKQDQEAFESPRDHYFKYQIAESAKRHDYFANLQKYRAWALVSLNTDERVEIIFSFHGIGRDSRGVLCCSAIYCNKDGDGEIREVHPLTEEPFEFTYHDDPVEVSARFSTWMEKAITTGIQEWSKSL